MLRLSWDLEWDVVLLKICPTRAAAVVPLVKATLDVPRRLIVTVAVVALISVVSDVEVTNVE